MGKGKRGECENLSCDWNYDTNGVQRGQVPSLRLFFACFSPFHLTPSRGEMSSSIFTVLLFLPGGGLLGQAGIFHLDVFGSRLIKFLAGNSCTRWSSSLVGDATRDVNPTPVLSFLQLDLSRAFRSLSGLFRNLVCKSVSF